MSSIAPYITDGLTTVDLSACQIGKTRTPRLSTSRTINRSGEILQTFSSEGFTLDVRGSWIIADSAMTDNRITIQRWVADNTLVKYNDGRTVGWYSIYDFENELQPGNVVHLPFSFKLSEAVPLSLDDSGTAFGSSVGPEPTPFPAFTPGAFNAFDFPHQGHAFVSQNPKLYWVVGTTSIGQSFNPITLWASSSGSDWFKSDQIATANPTSGISVFFNPSINRLEMTWAESNSLFYRRSTISGQAVSSNSIITVSTSSNAETNLFPYLFVSSAGNSFITVTSAGGLWMTYDSADGITWTGRPAYPNPALVSSTSNNAQMTMDLERHAVMWVTHVSSSGKTPESFVKRIFFTSQSAGALGTTARLGYSELNYDITATALTAWTGIGNQGNIALFALQNYTDASSGVSVTPAVRPSNLKGSIGIAFNHYWVGSTQSTGTVFYLSDSGGIYRLTITDYYNDVLDLGTLFTPAIVVNSDSGVGAVETIYGNKFRSGAGLVRDIAVGLVSAGEVPQVFVLENNKVFRYLFTPTGSQAQRDSTPFGDSFYFPKRITVPRYLLTQDETFAAWLEGGQ